MWFLLACRHASPVVEAPTVDLGPELSGEARAFYLRAKVAESRGDVAEVERSAEWVIRLDRANPYAWLHASELFLAVDRAALAENAALEAVARAPGLPDAHRWLGFSRLANGDAEGALQSLARAPGAEGVDAATIRAHLALNDEASAAAWLVQWTPTSGAGQLERARLTLVLGRPDVARDEAIGLVEDPVVGPEALALAVEAGREACDLGPVYTVAVERATRAADRRWRDALDAVANTTGDDALTERIVWIARDPVETAAWLVSAGRAEEALVTLGDLDAPEVLGRALLAVGRTEEAEAAFTRVPDPLGLALRADLRLSAGAPDEVLEMTALWTHDPSVAWVRAGALVAVGRKDEAVELVVATASDPSDAAARAARVYALAGEPELERAELERGLTTGGCPVAVWRALAPRLPSCEAAGLWERLAAVRVGDPEVAEALEKTRTACAEIRVPR